MRTIVASDLYGVTPELRALLAPLGEGSIFLSPWPGERCPFVSEPEAARAFHEQQGIARYADRISAAAGEGPAFVLGFSVGASAAWVHSSRPACDPRSFALLVYGSRIRDRLDLRPRCRVSAVFAEHEPSFAPADLVDALTAAGADAHIIAGTQHGFMNPVHAAYDPGQTAKVLERVFRRASG